MRSLLAAAGTAALMFGITACGSNYTAPTGTNNPPPAGAIVIDIVGINGAMSFRPNPATVPAGQMVVWYNRDTTTHHVVLDDGRLDTGNVAPGAYTVAMTLNNPGPYHCTIHPEMVGRTAAQ